jgi:hypothetical protein
MGREATCHCKWGDEAGDCKVLLEGSELILRRGIRRRVPVSAMTGVAVRGNELVFQVAQDQVELRLGSEVAQRWAKAIATPLPDLASKLGISQGTRVSVMGDVQSEELQAALARGSAAGGKEVDLTLMCVYSDSELDRLVSQWLQGESSSKPLWMVYPKGANSAVKESVLRELLLSRGFVDTKIASVSAKLTATRFVKRKS